MGAKEQAALARLRAEKIVQVLGGQLTASAAAQQLAESRKTFHKWLKRGLASLLASQRQKEAGRPAKAVDEEKERLRLEIAGLREELTILRQTQHIREQLADSGGKKG